MNQPAITQPTTLPVNELFELEVLSLTAARAKAALVHSMQNIRSSGDEIEESVKDFFRRRLAKRCDVGNGHIVDKLGRVTPDIDLIISDSFEFPSLQENRDGRQYFPYESVYAIAEIKSTYYKDKDPIKKFIATLKKIKSELQREKTPQDFIPSGLGSGILLHGQNNGSRPYLNPLFSFMIFIDSGDFAKEDVLNLYLETPKEYLPNLVCLLNKGTITYHRNPKLHPQHYESLPFPEFADEPDCVWALAPQSATENLAFLWAMLSDTLSNTVLMKPHYLAYVQSVFKINDDKLQIFAANKNEFQEQIN